MKPNGKWTTKHGEALYQVLQHGSDYLVERVKYKRNVARLITSSVVTLPLLGSSLSIWFFVSYGFRAGIASIVFTAFISALVIIASFQANVSVNRVILFAKQAIDEKS